MADAFLRAAALEHARTAVYNAGTGAPVSIADVLRTIVGLARVAVEIEPDAARMRDGDPSTLSLDSTRFRERTGWAPAIPLERSLADTLDYWRQVVSAELVAT
jgi:GDP-4-dehydro-6-deoxy-D-mannose reductase